MREYAEFKGRDIRAVENPYEAAFELSAHINRFAKSTGYWIIALLGFFTLYIAMTLAIVIVNILLFTKSDLRYLGIAMGLVNLCIGAYSTWLLGRSYLSLAAIHRDHGLMERIDKIQTGDLKPAPAETGPGPGQSAQRVLDRLIQATGKDSEHLFRTFRLVYLFIILWMANSVLYFMIQLFRFGPDVLNWKLDWIAPGGTGLDAFLFLFVSIIAYLKVRVRLDFIRTRYKAIAHALGRPRAKVPPGATPLERYKPFMEGQMGTGASGWSSTAYFSGVGAFPSGTVLVKALDTTPDAEALAEFVSHARAQGENVRHAVLLYPEDPEKPLPEEVYNEVVNNPIRAGKALFTVELVMEGLDGYYDFIPVVPP